MFSKGLALFLLCTITLSHANILQGTVDIKRLQKILQDNLQSKDVSALYHAIKGLKQLNAKIPDVCENIKNANYDIKSIEQVYYLTNAAALSGCQNSLKPDVLKAATLVLDKKDATIPELYFAVYTLKALGKGSVYDKEDGLKNLIQLLKKDDSPANYGYVFGLCQHMGCGAWSTSHAEGVLLAADESDSKLNFEGGLPITSLILTTILSTYKSLKKPSPLTEEQRYKFSEYLLSRSSVNSARGAALLLDAALALADDEPAPISISIKGKKYITSEADSVEISVSDLVGRPARTLGEVLAQSGTRLADDVVVLSKQPLTQKQNDPTTYILNLSKIKAQYGMYKIALSAGARTTSVVVAVLGEIQVAGVELGVGDVDGTTSPKVTTVTYPNKLTDKLHADHMQKVSVKFTVRDKYSKAALVQQAFVRVAAGEREAIFVAEPDNNKAYKVELSVSTLGAHVGRAAGAHSLWLYVGDSAAAAPQAWHIGDLHLSFGAEQAVGPVGGAPAGGRAPLPEVVHQFRAAEARPARVLSDVFASLSAAPLVLLLALWIKLGINLKNFPFTPSALVFHLGTAGSLALLWLLWVQLSMFETLRYLLPLAALTALAGRDLLRRRAAIALEKR